MRLETLDEAQRRKRLKPRPRESVRLERRSTALKTVRYLYFIYITFVFMTKKRPFKMNIAKSVVKPMIFLLNNGRIAISKNRNEGAQ